MPFPLALATPHQFDYILLFAFIFILTNYLVGYYFFILLKTPVFTPKLAILITETNTTLLFNEDYKIFIENFLIEILPCTKPITIHS